MARGVKVVDGDWAGALAEAVKRAGEFEPRGGEVVVISPEEEPTKENESDDKTG